MITGADEAISAVRDALPPGQRFQFTVTLDGKTIDSRFTTIAYDTEISGAGPTFGAAAAEFKNRLLDAQLKHGARP